MAMKQLRARLYEHELAKRNAAEKKIEDNKADINFGSQIRSYVLAPYRLIKDHRTKLGIGDVDRILDGDMEPFMHAWLVWKRTGRIAGADGKDELPES
jgi:peptide chain release factor 2